MLFLVSFFNLSFNLHHDKSTSFDLYWWPFKIFQAGCFFLIVTVFHFSAAFYETLARVGGYHLFFVQVLQCSALVLFRSIPFFGLRKRQFIMEKNILHFYVQNIRVIHNVYLLLHAWRIFKLFQN